MNTKSDVVARNHLLFDVNGLDKYREWTVITVEKNRQGHDAVELEFRKRFQQGSVRDRGQDRGRAARRRNASSPIADTAQTGQFG
jgi:hypothetical protein